MNMTDSFACMTDATPELAERANRAKTSQSIGDPIVAVTHDGHTLHVTTGRAFFLVSGHTIHRQYAPRTDADLAQSVAEWSTRRQWVGLGAPAPLEIVALTKAEVAALIATGMERTAA